MRLPVMLYQVHGASMLPDYYEGKLVLAYAWFRRLAAGDVIIIRHQNRDKLKRIQKIRGDELFVVGDNPLSSTDSRDFGWLPKAAVVAKVLSI